MDQYGNSKMGFKKYKDPKIFRSSGEELFTKDFLENYMSDLHINFTSSEGRAESYNMFHRGKEKHRFFEKFISANPNTGGHFKTRSSASDEIIDGEDKDAEQVDTEEEEEEGERSTMHLLGRRNLSSGFYNHELVCELAERGRLEEAIFGPKESPEDENKTVTYKESIEDFMREIDDLRREELYSHNAAECPDGCRLRGCGQVNITMLFMLILMVQMKK